MSDPIVEAPVAESTVVDLTAEELLAVNEQLQISNKAHVEKINELYIASAAVLTMFIFLAIVLPIIFEGISVVKEENYPIVSGMIIGLGIAHTLTSFVVDKYASALFGIVSVVMMLIINSLVASL